MKAWWEPRKEREGCILTGGSGSALEEWQDLYRVRWREQGRKVIVGRRNHGNRVKKRGSSGRGSVGGRKGWRGIGTH